MYTLANMQDSIKKVEATRAQRMATEPRRMTADEIPTLIFDEIDSGISGRTAQMVSQKMKLLAKTHQIICITHLPQIAAMADAHFLIEKSVERASTVSRIHPLREEESIEELARMLGGVEITDTVLQNAREMKRLAEKYE